MSANGGSLASGRSLVSASEPLLVPSADVTAKNLRASLHNRTASGNYDSDDRMQRRAMSILDKVVGSNTSGDETLDKDAPPKFTRLVEDSPSMLVQLKSFIYRMRTSGKSKKSSSFAKRSSSNAQSNLVLKTLGKLCDIIEYSPLPPMVYFLAMLFLIIVLKLVEPVRLLKKFPYIPHMLEAMLIFSACITILWKRSRVFYTLSRGENPYRHPIDSCLEPYSEFITERAAQVKLETEELADNHAQLDALRKELAKDPAAHIPGSVLKPSRKAAAMIRNGALGAGYDAEKAAEAEEMRKKERQRESHKLWREKSISVGNNGANGDEELEKITKHAATRYRKHTKELKMRAAPKPPPAVNAFKKASAAVVGASSAASAFAGIAAGTVGGGNNNSGRGSGENTRDQSGSSGGRRDGSGSGTGASGLVGGVNGLGIGGIGNDGQSNSFSVFGNVIHPINMDNTRRSSGGSDISVRTAASGPSNAAVSRQNSKRFKMHLFRRKRSNMVPPSPILASGVPLTTTASAPLPSATDEMVTTPMTFTVPLNGTSDGNSGLTPVALSENTMPDSHSAVLGENVRNNVNGNASSNGGSRRSSKTHSRLPSFPRLSAKRRAKTMNLNGKPGRDKL